MREQRARSAASDSGTYRCNNNEKAQKNCAHLRVLKMKTFHAEGIEIHGYAEGLI